MYFLEHLVLRYMAIFPGGRYWGNLSSTFLSTDPCPVVTGGPSEQVKPFCDYDEINNFGAFVGRKTRVLVTRTSGKTRV